MSATTYCLNGSLLTLIIHNVCCTIQSQIQDFRKEGARFRVKCHVDAIQWGGGVVAEMFRDLKNPTRFSGGGGSRNFS